MSNPIVVWAVAWRPAAGGSWGILHDDGVPVVFDDRRFADRRARVQGEKFPDHLYQPLPMEGEPPEAADNGGHIQGDS